MSTAILEPAVAPLTPLNPRHDNKVDWEAPCGPADANAQPRTKQPAFIYCGYAEEHWRGQTCNLVGAAHPDERTVIMACGCQASVPWWTLEPIVSG